MKVAIVYDRVNKWGGAERVLLALHEIWPDAPLYTAVYNDKKAGWSKVFPVVMPSFLQKFPFAKTHHEFYPWLTPLAFESFNFDAFDVVISVTSAEAKSLITKPHTLHICYCLTPTRYLWSGYDEYLNNPGFGLLNSVAKMVLPSIFSRLQQIDKVTCRRPDYYIAISQTVKNRIKKYYQQESQVIYPPVDTDFFKIKNQFHDVIARRDPSLSLRAKRSNPNDSSGQAPQSSSKIEIATPRSVDRNVARNDNSKNDDGYFLIVSRLVPYKRVDLAIDAFNQLGWKLKIVGSGSQKRTWQQMANPNIEFLGELTELELLGYYQECTALLVCQEEDFGLVSLEAQACGKPVIAFSGGGVVETVINGKTGLLFDKQNAQTIRETLEKFKTIKFLSKNCRENTLKYNLSNFKKNFLSGINKLWEEKNQKITM